MNQQILQIVNFTPEQLDETVRRAVRSELVLFDPVKPPSELLPEYLTRKETAKLLRISLVTLHKLSNEGALQSLDLMGQVRYRRVDVLAALKEVKNGGTKR